ncbi:MAG TPA: entericidin [Candidatus Omnitrophota bacterium]|nr:entericidin [Candidatus Omnitrophota bacterium]
MKNIILLIILSIFLAGCETVKGLGKDLTNTGENLEEVGEKIRASEAEK